MFSELFQELFSVRRYKTALGRYVRYMTMFAIWVIFFAGAYKFYTTIEFYFFANLAIRAICATVIVLFGLWLGFRAIHYARFADFLITVESEMMKVSWPSNNEVYSSTIVVLVMFVLLATAIWICDMFWVVLFRWFGVM